MILNKKNSCCYKNQIFKIGDCVDLVGNDKTITTAIISDIIYQVNRDDNDGYLWFQLRCPFNLMDTHPSYNLKNYTIIQLTKNKYVINYFRKKAIEFFDLI